MSKWIIGVAALCVIMVFSFSVLCYAATPEEELELRRQELDRLQREIEEQKQMIQQKKQQENSVSVELRRLEQELDRTKKQLAVVEADIALTQRRASDMAVEVKKAQASLDQRSQMLSSRVRALYDVGAAGYIDVLLSSTSFADFMGRFDFVQSVIDLDVNLMKRIKAEREQYLAKKNELEAQQDRLEDLKGQKQKSQVLVGNRAADRERYLSKLTKERQEYEKGLDELEQLSEELVKTIQDLQSKSKVTQKSKLTFGWPVVGRVTSQFGRRVHPILRRVRMHTGLDIPVKTGTPVKASEDGLVIHSGWLGGYGKAVIIDHGSGLSSLYAHNSSLAVSAGQTVAKGKVIALAGSTGLSTGPHVHFEIRKNGTPVDPKGYLK